VLLKELLSNARKEEKFLAKVALIARILTIFALHVSDIIIHLTVQQQCSTAAVLTTKKRK